MLISKTTKVKWNARNKKRFVNLGYKFTKMNDIFEVNIKDLSNSSSAKIKIKCDYCGKIYELQYDTWMRRHNKNSDCCGNPTCTSLKAKIALKEKYGTENIREIESINDKIKRTNIQKYGCENPFGNKDIQNKIKETTIKKYGCVHNSQNKEISKRKSVKCKNFYKKHPEKIKIKEKSPNWIGDADYKRSKRATFEYNEWRSNVYKRDSYTCQCCGMHRIKSSQPPLNAHHIVNFAQNEDLQTDINNGITLCKNCHILFHNIYGKKNNNLAQIIEFIKNYNITDEKIC